MTLHLGKLPARPDAIALKLATYATALPTPPPAFGHQASVSAWGMLGNDAVGDCVIAGGMHESLVLNAGARRPIPSFTTGTALSMYSAITGYDPRDPSSDRGTDMEVAAKYRRKYGLIDAVGGRHKIAAYTALTEGDVTQLAAATWLFGAVGVGFELPESALEQARTGRPWTVVRGSKIAGGHYVPIVGRNPNGSYIGVSWGEPVVIAADFVARYCDEAVAYLSAEQLNSATHQTPEGFNTAALTDDLHHITQGRS